MMKPHSNTKACYLALAAMLATPFADAQIPQPTDAPAGPVRDAGAGTLIPRARESDPHTALEWVATLGDPAERANQLAHGARAVETYATEARAVRWAGDEAALDGHCDSVSDYVEKSGPSDRNRTTELADAIVALVGSCGDFGVGECGDVAL